MDLTQEQYDILISWMERYLVPTHSITSKVDTSDIRKAFMDSYIHGFYLDNDTINKACLLYTSCRPQCASNYSPYTFSLTFGHFVSSYSIAFQTK